jgi:hypothetical protein
MTDRSTRIFRRSRHRRDDGSAAFLRALAARKLDSTWAFMVETGFTQMLTCHGADRSILWAMPPERRRRQRNHAHPARPVWNGD